MMVPRVVPVVWFYYVFGVTRGWPTRWCLLETEAVQGDLGLCFQAHGLPGETGACPPQYVPMS